MKPIRCLAISNSYPPDHAGGYEIGACNILESLATHCGWENTVLSAVRKEKSPKTDAPELTGFFPGKLGPGVERWKTRRSLLKHHATVVERLRDLAEEADLVFVFNPRRLIYPQWISALSTKTPSFVFVSDHWPNHPLASDIFHARSKKDAPRTLLKKPLRQLYESAPSESEVLASFHGVLFGSRFLQTEQAEVFSEHPNQAVAHWGIDTGKFPQVTFSTERIKTFGFCGRPEKEKGLDIALEAVRELAANDKGIQFLVASDLQASAFGRGLQKHIQSDPVLKKTVRLLGQIPHADLHAKFYSQIGVLLFPSVWQEPFALTVLEAMSTGVLVIGSSTGGTPEVVNASTGWLFNPEVKGELASCCRKVLQSDPADLAQLAQNSSRCIRESHTLECMARKVDDFVRSLL